MGQDISVVPEHQCIRHAALRTSVTEVFMFTAIRGIASHLAKMIASISGILSSTI